MKKYFIAIMVLFAISCANQTAQKYAVPKSNVFHLNTMSKQTSFAVSKETTRMISPNRKWIAVCEGAQLYVVNAETKVKTEVHRTITTLSWFWCPGMHNVRLVYSYGPSNGKTSYVYNPTDKTSVNISKEAFQRVKNNGTIHSIPISCSPDNLYILLRITGNLDQEGFFCVSTQNGKIQKEFSSDNQIPYQWWR